MKKYLRMLLSLLLVCSFLPFNLPVHMTEAANSTNARPYIVDAVYADGKITVTFGAKGDLASYDLEVIYNGDEVEVESYKYDSGFKDEYMGYCTSEDMGNGRDYAVFGGASFSDTHVWDDVVGQVVFKVKDGITSTEISVCKDSANYNNEKPLREIADKMDSRLVEMKKNTSSGMVLDGCGDLNGDGAISIEDAYQCLRLAYRYDSVTEELGLIADLDGSGQINLKDVQLLLNQVIGLEQTRNGYKVVASDAVTESLYYNMTENADDTYTLNISVENADISMFDYGILLGDEWSVEGITWGEWVKQYSALSAYGNVMNQDGEDEFHFAGVCLDFNEVQYTGTICELIIKANVPDPFHLLICPNSMNQDRDRYIPVPNDGHYRPTKECQPFVTSASYADGKITVDIGANGSFDTFDIGLMYDSSKVVCTDIKYDEEFKNTYTDGTFVANNQMSPGDYVVYGGINAERMHWKGAIAHATFEFKDDADSAEFAVCKNSAQYLPLKSALRDVAEIADSKVVEKKTAPETKTEIITNPDGTTTEKKTESRVEGDGTKKETVKETTETTSGALKVTETETSTKTDGSTETVKKETVTNPDGSLEQQIETIRKEYKRLLKLVEKLLKVTEELYNYYVKKEQQLADGSTLIKEVSESAVEVNGRIQKSSIVKDEKKDSTGKSMEAFEYDSSVLDKDTEWKTDKKENVEDAYKDKVEAEKPLNSVMYDITPTVSGEAVQVSGGSVRVSLYYGEPKKEGSRFKVYDCRKDAWLDAHYENGYIVFDAAHFSKYVITEVDGVQPGDVDGDGNVTLSDAQLCLKAALKIGSLDDTQIQAADMDGDNQVTLGDAQLCLKTALKII